jgi:hypothetical protein
MRHRLTVVPVGLVLAIAAMMGADGPSGPQSSAESVLDERFGMKIAPIYLLLRADVQADLRLEPRQIAAARNLAASLMERGRRLKGMPERDAQTERSIIDEQMAGWLRHALSEAQRERLRQITLQWEGAAAFGRSAVADYLELDPQQQSALGLLLRETDQIRRKRRISPPEVDRITARARTVLTPDQQEKWKAVIGPSCRFQFGGTQAGSEAAVPAPRVTARPTTHSPR